MNRSTLPRWEINRKLRTASAAVAAMVLLLSGCTDNDPKNVPQPPAEQTREQLESEVKELLATLTERTANIVNQFPEDVTITNHDNNNDPYSEDINETTLTKTVIYGSIVEKTSLRISTHSAYTGSPEYLTVFSFHRNSSTLDSPQTDVQELGFGAYQIGDTGWRFVLSILGDTQPTYLSTAPGDLGPNSIIGTLDQQSLTDLSGMILTALDHFEETEGLIVN